ncbi:MAG: hypothetical protein HFJ45_00230 [Clostridia bacterium]|nr:hypothetical protein [Clostridia bacterium]
MVVTINVEGVIDSGDKTIEKYLLNVVYYKGNLTLGAILTSNGTEVKITDLVLKNDTEWTCGNANDIATGT